MDRWPEGHRRPRADPGPDSSPRLGDGNPGDHRNLTDGISEMRVDAGPGYRVYYTRLGKQWVILLVGGDKGSQQRDIEKAKALARDL